MARLLKKILSFCIVAALIFNVSALSSSLSAKAAAAHSQLNAGDYLFFGTGYDDKPLNWIVLEADGSEAWLLALDVLADENGDVLAMEINKHEPVQTDLGARGAKWDSQFRVTDIALWLNGEVTHIGNGSAITTDNSFYETAFTEEEKACINDTRIISYVRVNQEFQWLYEYNETEESTHKIFLLDLSDVRPGGIASEYKKAGYFWWLRSPGSNPKAWFTATVHEDGTIFSYGDITNMAYAGVRPSMKINVSEMVLTSSGLLLPDSLNPHEDGATQYAVQTAEDPQPGALESIEIESLPNRQVYNKGDLLDTEGLVVRARYSDGSDRIVTDFEVSPADGYALTVPGMIPVTVSYTEAGVTQTAQFAVKVMLDASLKITTIVSTLSAYVSVVVSDASFDGEALTVYLNADEEGSWSAPVAGDTGRIYIDKAPSPGTHNITVKTVSGIEVGTCTIKVVEYKPAELWVPNFRPDNNTGRALIEFGDEIGHKTGGRIAVTTGAAPVGYEITGDKKGLLLDIEYGDVDPGTTITVAGLKYPVLFPSYSFTFTFVAEK